MNETEVIVYLERRKTRQEVGRLRRQKESGRFRFDYENAYLKTTSAIPVGPELSLAHRFYESDTLFPSFTDRIPSRENPAYAEYCRVTGISVEESDPLVLLGAIGRRGPSSFVFETVREGRFTSTDLMHFRVQLGLTTREFASCFELTQSALSKIESGKESGTELLKRLRIYARFPDVALNQLDQTGGVLTDAKRNYCRDVLQKIK
jgi:HipA-like protein